MKIRNTCLAVAALFCTVGAANAAVITNTSLNSPGVYYGTGNINSGFTVDRTGSVETGLSAIERFVGPITPIGSTYNVSTGATSEVGHTGSDWGFVFSVNLNADGNGTLNLGNITTRLSLQDVGLGTTGFFDALIIPDNTEYGAGGKCTPAILCGSSANYYAFQNSEALSFLGIATILSDPLYDINADDTYIFGLDVFSGNTLLSSDQITVVAGRGAAVPEPLTISLFSAGLVGAAVARRRRAARK
jgi:hypothetical protein